MTGEGQDELQKVRRTQSAFCPQGSAIQCAGSRRLLWRDRQARFAAAAAALQVSQFNVLGLDARQQVVALNLEAANAAIAADQARKQGLTVLSLDQPGFSLKRSFGRKKRFPTTLFSVELMSLLEAGLNLVEALQTLADKEAHGERQEVLSGILAAINRGEPFSQAVAGFPPHLSPLYVASGKASERTRRTPGAAGRLM